jgi:predicted nucleic acid-binding protein
MAFVCDNSVVVAWFIASQASAYTDKLLDRAIVEDVHVPLIWRAEFAAMLLAFSHNRRLIPARVPVILNELEQLELINDLSPPSLKTLVDIGRRYALGAYDATYLELAMRLRLPLACRDGPLKAALPKAGVALA